MEPGQADMIFSRFVNEHAHLVLRQGLEAGKPSINACAMLICARRRSRLRGQVSKRPIYLLNLLGKEVAKVIGKLVRVAGGKEKSLASNNKALVSWNSFLWLELCC